MHLVAIGWVRCMQVVSASVSRVLSFDSLIKLIINNLSPDS
jgi:hypothetical protein